APEPTPPDPIVPAIIAPAPPDSAPLFHLARVSRTPPAPRPWRCFAPLSNLPLPLILPPPLPMLSLACPPLRSDANKLLWRPCDTQEGGVPTASCAGQAPCLCRACHPPWILVALRISHRMSSNIGLKNDCGLCRLL
uniref:Uncharacterized protein n=1 Tax=Triticum urartu TaxID=4572 RepID=A0A8R7PSY2_TRIUA